MILAVTRQIVLQCLFAKLFWPENNETYAAFESSCNALVYVYLCNILGGGFTWFLLMLNVKQESWEYQFLLSLVLPDRESNSNLLFQYITADVSSTQSLKSYAAKRNKVTSPFIYACIAVSKTVAYGSPVDAFSISTVKKPSSAKGLISGKNEQTAEISIIMQLFIQRDF